MSTSFLENLSVKNLNRQMQWFGLWHTHVKTSVNIMDLAHVCHVYEDRVTHVSLNQNASDSNL